MNIQIYLGIKKVQMIAITMVAMTSTFVRLYGEGHNGLLSGSSNLTLSVRRGLGTGSERGCGPQVILLTQFSLASRSERYILD